MVSLVHFYNWGQLRKLETFWGFIFRIWEKHYIIKHRSILFPVKILLLVWSSSTVMFTFQVVGLAALKKYVALLREAAANYYGDLKFSRSSPPSLTLTVCGPSNKGHRFVAAVQLLEPLFSVVSATDDGDYRYQFHLEEFFHALNCTKDDFCLTAIIPESAGKANFLFCSSMYIRCFFRVKFYLVYYIWTNWVCFAGKIFILFL